MESCSHLSELLWHNARAHEQESGLVTIEDVLVCIRRQLDLDAETEHDVLEELRAHLEDAVADARVRGKDEGQAIAQAAARFGAPEVGAELQSTHAGWGTADGVIAAALPVLCTLVLRWMVFSPGGTAVGWQEILTRPAFWTVALVALLVPLLRFSRWRYALASWAVFWGLSVTFMVWSAVR
jgi:hypothetical protein